MRVRFIWKMALVAGCVGFSAPAFADYPKGWAEFETTAYTMALPGNWREFRQNLFEPTKNPMLGAWYYMGPTGQGKVFVRVRALTPGSIQDSIKKTQAVLARKVADVKPMAPPVFVPPDENKREVGIAFFKGISTALDKKTGKDSDYEHFIARVVVHDPKSGLKVVLTYLFGPQSSSDPQAFAEQHLQTIKLNTLAKAQEIYQRLAKEKKATPAKP